jgi:type II secretory pathway component PulM
MNLSLNSMTERERRLVYICAGVAVLVLLFAVIVPLERSVTQAHHRVEKKTGDLAWMRVHAPQVAAMPSPIVKTNESLLVVVDRAARESSDLAKSLQGSEPSGAGGLRVRFEKAPFDTLVGWLARLQQQMGIQVDSATIDNAGKPGIVNAAVVLNKH